MGKLRSTIGFVGEDGIMLRDHSVFDKGEVVVVVSTENIDEILNEILEIQGNIESSKRWIDEIKEIE